MPPKAKRPDLTKPRRALKAPNPNRSWLPIGRVAGDIQCGIWKPPKKDTFIAQLASRSHAMFVKTIKKRQNYVTRSDWYRDTYEESIVSDKAHYGTHRQMVAEIQGER